MMCNATLFDHVRAVFYSQVMFTCKNFHQQTPSLSTCKEWGALISTETGMLLTLIVHSFFKRRLSVSPGMNCTLEKVLADAKSLVERLRNHDNAAEMLIEQTTSLNKRVDAMKQVRCHCHMTLVHFSMFLALHSIPVMSHLTFRAVDSVS